MSGVAAISAGDAPTIGLVPRYLRGKEASINQPWAPEWDQPAQHTPATVVHEPPPPPVMRVASPTEELRRRIAETALPEKRRSRPLLIGVLALALVVVASLLFPDTVFALLPDVDTSM